MPSLPMTCNINRDNCALDFSTTDFITRKLYTTGNKLPFEFDDDTYSNYVFGYHNEM